MKAKDTPRTEKLKRVSGKISGRTIFNQLVLLFLIGCVFGTIWEEVIHLIQTAYETGTPVWESRRGLVYGPLSPVYGIGAMLVYLIFYLTKLKGWVCFVGGVVFGGVLEILLSLLQEWIFGTRSWDYTGWPGDIFGRTTLIFMIVWGGLVFVFARFVFPFLDRLYHKIPEKKINVVCIVLAIFLAFDILVSVAATLRQTGRRMGDPADTGIERFLDDRFPDERLQRIYSNMRPTEEIGK